MVLKRIFRTIKINMTGQGIDHEESEIKISLRSHP
jgi:hypothetical protein